MGRKKKFRKPEYSVFGGGKPFLTNNGNYGFFRERVKGILHFFWK